MQPVALQANKELYSAQYEEIAKTLEARVASGNMTAAEAQNIANKAFGIYMNPYGAMTSRNPLEQMVAINAYTSGNGDKPAYYTNSYLSTSDMMLSWGADSLQQNIIGTYLANDPTMGRRRNLNKTSVGGVKVNNTEEQLKLFQREMGRADNYNTNSDKINKAILNATAEIGDIKAILSDKLWSVGEVIVSGITAWLGAKIVGGAIGKGIGALAGASAGGTGAGILATAGGIAVGVIGGVLATKAIADAIVAADEEKTKRMNEASIEQGEKNKANSFDNANVQAVIEQTEAMGKTGSFGDKLANGFNKAGLFGVGAMFGWGNSYSAKEKAAWNEGDWKNYNIYKPLSAGINDKGGADPATRAAFMIAYALALKEVGYLSDGIMSEIFGNAVNINNDKDLYQFIASSYKNLGVGFSSVASVAQMIKSDVGAPYDSTGKEWDGTIADVFYSLMEEQKDQNDKEIAGYIYDFKSHRYGLDDVPYDNYPAMLHEGEAVLTSSTANELRNLLDEYRNNNQSSANLEAIVNQQTNDLCNKLDEVITTIARINVGTGNMTASSIDQAKAQNLLKTSMLHMRSTKNGLN